jgi:sulfide:quinone oxidoreductase
MVLSRKLDIQVQECKRRAMGTRSPSGNRVRVVIAGGGVAALEATLALRALAEDRVVLQVVAPESEFTYRPLAVAEPFRVGEVERLRLQTLTKAAGADLREGLLTSVDPERHVVVVDADDELSYDILFLALGALPRPAVAGALTFGGPQDGPALAALLEAAVTGSVRSIVFALPLETRWPLPLYELALLTGTYLKDRGTMGVAITLVTSEDAPLALFGAEASDAIRELLELRGIDLCLGAVPLRFEGGALQMAPEGAVEADRVVALPRFEGPRVPGIPCDRLGFVSTDEVGRLVSEEDIYAAGDMTQFPVKQGGIATQQADAAASAVAARAGAPVEPTPFRPVLRGLLLTGMAPRYLRAEAGTRPGIDIEPLWWPPAKIVGRYLAPFLATHLRISPGPPPGLAGHAVPVEVELDPRDHSAWSPL